MIPWGVPRAPSAYSPQWINDMLGGLKAATERGKDNEIFRVLHAEPAKLFDGMVVNADGTDWNPGFGAGLYRYDSTLEQWVHLGSNWIANVKDFGATGDGETSDVAAIIAAFTACKTVYFPDGTYSFGNLSASNTIAVNLSALGSGITMIVDAGAEFVCNTTDSTNTTFFYLESNSHFTVKGTARFRDAGYDPTITLRGANCFKLSNAAGNNWGNVNIDAIYATRCVSPLSVDGDVSATNRIRGIHVGQIFCDDTFYGPNFQNQGDAVKIDAIYTYQVYRAYFAYGVTGHDVSVFDRNPRASSGLINISRSHNGLATRGLRVRLVQRDNTASIVHVLLNHVGPSTGEITGIDLDLDIEESVTNVPVRIVTYDASGGSETGSSLANVMADIRIRGRYVGGGASPVLCTAAYTTQGFMRFDGGTGLTLDSSVPPQFRMSYPTTYTPTWSCAAGAAPALGNGSLSGTYTINGAMCQVSVTLVIGTTTTLGGGIWQFSTPAIARSANLGVARILQAGVAFYLGASSIADASQQVQVTTQAAATQVQAAVPFAWANGDTLFLTIQFPM